MSTQDYQRPALGDGKPYNPMREPRFTEIATFMRAPLAAALENVDIGLIGVPTDLGVTNRPGARHGPREIRNASSLMRGFNLGLGVLSRLMPQMQVFFVALPLSILLGLLVLLLVLGAMMTVFLGEVENVLTRLAPR